MADYDKIEEEFRKHLATKTKEELIELVIDFADSKSMLELMFEWEHEKKKVKAK
jgi:hypothetical protein